MQAAEWVLRDGPGCCDQRWDGAGAAGWGGGLAETSGDRASFLNPLPKVGDVRKRGELLDKNNCHLFRRLLRVGEVGLHLFCLFSVCESCAADAIILHIFM